MATASGGLILLFVFLAQGIIFIRANSPTYDEPMHLAAGYSYLATRDFRLEPQNPPFIKAVLALPIFFIYDLPFAADPQQWRDASEFFIGQDFLYHAALPADHMLFLSRLANLWLGALTVALVGWWSYRLWGDRAAILGLALAALEPNLVAHSSLVTTDVGATLFIFLSVYLLWEYLGSPRWWFLIGTGMAAGMALVSKFSAILLLPILALIVVLCCFFNEKRLHLLPAGGHASLWHGVLEPVAVFFLIVFFALLMIPPAYLFQGFQPWISGFYSFLTLARVGQPAFFLGEHSYLGWWSYFIVAFLIKTPTGTLLLIFASLLLWRGGTPLKRREAIFLMTPVVFFFVVLSQAKVNIGLRHILPVYPFLFVLASRLATIRFRSPGMAAALVGGPLALTAVSSLRIAPHQLAYFNELVGGPDEGYRYLSDSNVDWGQDLKGVKAYMEKENLPIIYLSYFGTAPPSYYGIRYQYVPGAWPLEWPPPSDTVPADMPRKVLAISVYNLQDVAFPDDPLFRWLWTRRPIAKIGYSIFVYDLTHDLQGLAELEATYVKSGTGSIPISRGSAVRPKAEDIPVIPAR
ncbi:MAG TPA: phospholipid carrier-dependent glycosyltransferase [Candidatus Eisenbacteria bacterium]|nr:phospholipid carrier-dependent glycosyltransferase [Candidatus Eisenbacteria bacterium]